MRTKVWILLSLLLVSSLVLAGCGSRITAEEVVAKMQETVDSTVDGHAVITVNVDAQDIVLSATVEIWEKSPNQFRAEVIESSRANLAGMTMVSDGQKGWVYNPARNQVQIGTVDEMDSSLPQQMLAELRVVLQEVLEVSNVELEGEEAVAGREAYKLILSPKEDADQTLFPGGGTATLWVDKEQWFPLKAIYEGNVFGQGSVEVQSFELNPGLTDDLFVFVVPEGAEVVEIEPKQIEPLTLDEALAQTDFPLLIPEYVPEEATLIEVLKAGDSYVLRYDHSPQISFTIVQGSELEGPPPLGDSQGITVRGQEATAITDEAGGNTFLYWTEDGVMITVAGHISLDEALKVAESMK